MTTVGLAVETGNDKIVTSQSIYVIKIIDLISGVSL
jgi:hypothetical protein